MNGYREDVRQRVVGAVQDGASQTEAVRMFAVSDRTMRRYLRRQREMGSVAPVRQRDGPHPAIGPDDHACLIAQVAAHSDATPEEQSVQ